MTTIEQECSRHNQSTSQKLNDSQGATIELDNPLSNSYGNEHPPLFLAPTTTGGLYIVYRLERYELERDFLRDLLVFGRPVHLVCGGMLAPDTRCSRHPNGTGIILNINDLEFIIPRDRFERVAKAEVPGLVVRPAGVTDV
jgi:hypothetical protein